MAQDYELTIMNYIKVYDFFNEKKTRKTKITRLQMNNMLRRTMRMFKWSGLPDTITTRNLELTIQTRGYIGIIKNNDDYYAVYGGLGGVPNWEYMPSLFIVSNPYLQLQAQTYYIYDGIYNGVKHEKDTVIIPNDSLYQGLLPTLSYHSEILTEIQFTKRALLINNRFPALMVAPDNRAKKDLDDYLGSLEDGEPTAILSKNMLRDLQVIPVDNGAARNIITQTLEAEQYQKAALFNDVGLQMNYNMKRETITSSEAQLGEGALLPLPDDMMDMRKEACRQVKDVFGLDWSVEFDSAWADLRKSIQAGIEAEQNEGEQSNRLDSQETNGNEMGTRGNSTGENGSEQPSDDTDVATPDEERGPSDTSDKTAEEAIEEIGEIVNQVEGQDEVSDEEDRETS